MIRNSEMTVEIYGEESAPINHKYAITILNKNADEHAGIKKYYNKLISIKSIGGTLYDAIGKKLKNR